MSASPLRKQPNGLGARPAGIANAVKAEIKSEPATVKINSGLAECNSAASTSASGVVKKEEDSNNSSKTREFVLRCCSKKEVDGIRYHVMRFQSHVKIDPLSQFTPPVRLHRRDPRNLVNNMNKSTNSEGEQPRDAAGAGQQKDQNSTVDYSLVAPDGGKSRRNGPAGSNGGGTAGNSNNFHNKKTRQVMGMNEKARRLRYEEHFPWVLEDFEAQNIWVGNYEAAQSDTFAAFVFDGDGFKMVPLEKWYKMTPRNRFATLSAEEAEKRMEKQKKVPRWIMQKLQGDTASGQAQGEGRLSRKSRLKTVYTGPADDPAEGSRRRGYQGSGSGASRDHDEMDYDEEFADDEEAPILDGNDEDLKEVQEKMRREMLNANAIGAKQELDDDDDDDDDGGTGVSSTTGGGKGGRKSMNREGKRLRRYLATLEKNANYDSDDEVNPYASDRDFEDADEDADDDENDYLFSNASIKKEQSERPKSSELANIIRMPFIKKEIKHLLPGMVVIQLPPRILSRFPRSTWNPQVAMRKADDVDEPSQDGSKPKKAKLNTKGSLNGQSSGAANELEHGPREITPIPVVSAKEDDPDLLTEEQVRTAICSGRLSTKELLGVLKPKLKKHPQNADRLRLLLRSIAKLQDGVLLLKE